MASPRAYPRRPSLALAPAALTLIFLVPIAAGVVGTLLPALGWMPVLGAYEFSLRSWRELTAEPGIGRATLLSLATGIGTTLLAFVLVQAFFAHWYGSRGFARLRRLLSPLLSVPHVAIAFGLAFLIAPSGWIFRILAALGLAGPVPPDLPLVQDPLGIGLTIGLVLKETPFLLLMTLVALEQVPVDRTLLVARSLGYAPATAWMKTVFPRLYPQLRLPIYAVIAYSASVVDVALVLGPGNPPTLAVMIWRWFQDPDLSRLFPAAAGACLQLALVVAAIGLWRGGERVVGWLGLRWIAIGGRGGTPICRLPVLAAMWAVVAVAGASLAAMIVWSLAAAWPAGEPLPSRWSLAVWERGLASAAGPLVVTVATGLASAAAALVLVVALLEREKRERSRIRRRREWLLYAPLLLPQIGFLFGVQILLVVCRLDGSWAALVWSHFLFVLPYVYLSLADPWRAFDPRYERISLSLGRSRGWAFLRVKAPLLARPIAVALALGFAVSVGQYLPTLFAGAGRIATITTEAVTLAAGGDRRLVGVYAGLQMLLPAAAFAAALLVRRPGARGTA